MLIPSVPGKSSSGRRSLPDIGSVPNPYEQAISVLRKNSFQILMITILFHDLALVMVKVFGFYHDNRPCNGFREALQRYRELVPGIKT
ncbi:hypothetical protein BHE74_00044938 [Ensete ventricosum]|nr:hypothetical protein BHE74_00044938 [Ensete ventricosum]RZR81347.1 hypothetical protein BHM03_00007539 [Ensete ventricosum]